LLNGKLLEKNTQELYKQKEPVSQILPYESSQKGSYLKLFLLSQAVKNVFEKIMR
jgi:hypothetical protein